MRSTDEIAVVLYDASVAKAKAERPGSVAPWSKASTSARHTCLMLAEAVLQAFPELKVTAMPSFELDVPA